MTEDDCLDDDDDASARYRRTYVVRERITARDCELDFTQPEGWHAPSRVFNADCFRASRPWLEDVRNDALMFENHKQANHAAHLIGQIDGEIEEDYSTRKKRDLFASAASSLGDVLVKLYEFSPVPAFLAAMSNAGVIPIDPHRIGAGNIVHTFHVLGDPQGSVNGWAVLHRCPGAGSFGNWRTKVVHRWHSRPALMEQTTEQFEQDFIRAAQTKDSQKSAA